MVLTAILTGYVTTLACIWAVCNEELGRLRLYATYHRNRVKEVAVSRAASATGATLGLVSLERLFTYVVGACS